MIVQILWGVGLPAVFAGVILLLAWFRGPGRSWGGPLALGWGFALAQYALFGWPLPWNDATQGLLFIGASAGLLGALESLSPPLLRWPLRAASAAALLALVLPWHRPEAVFWALGLGAGVMALTAALELAAKRRTGPGFALQLWAIATAVSISLTATASVVLGLRAAAMAGMLGAAAVVGWLFPRLSFERGAGTVFVIQVSGLLFNGQYYSKLPMSSAIVLGMAPLWLALGELPFIRSMQGRKALGVRLALLLLPLALGLGLALIAGMPAEDDPYGGYN